MQEETIGQRIRRLRQEQRLSQDALARKIGISRQAVFNVERGAVKAPNELTVHGYAEALGVSVLYLKTGKGDCWQ